MTAIIRLLLLLVRWVPVMGRWLLRLGPWLVAFSRGIWNAIGKGFSYVVTSLTGWFGFHAARRAVAYGVALVVWETGLQVFFTKLPSIIWNFFPEKIHAFFATPQISWFALNVLHLDLAFTLLGSLVALWVSVVTALKFVNRFIWLLKAAGQGFA